MYIKKFRIFEHICLNFPFIRTFINLNVILIGFKSVLAESPDHMQSFAAGLTNENLGIRQQIPITANFGRF